MCGLRWAIYLAAFLTITVGCGSGNQRLQQLQNENDRLLSEYRAQRDQVTQLNEKLAVAQNRLAESEKLLARQSPMPSSRLSRLNDPGSLTSTGPRTTGLASGTPTTGTAKPGASTETGANSSTELHWRPMRRETP
jgi:hypothetical protein